MDRNPAEGSPPQPSPAGDAPAVRIKLRFQKFSAFVAEYSSLVSLAGMFVKTPQPPSEGTRVEIDLRLADGFGLLRAVGEVVWRRPAGAEPAGAAVRFRALDEKGRQLLLKLLEEHVKGGGRPFELGGAGGGAPPAPRRAPESGGGGPAAAAEDLDFGPPWGERLSELPREVLDPLPDDLGVADGPAEDAVDAGDETDGAFATEEEELAALTPTVPEAGAAGEGAEEVVSLFGEPPLTARQQTPAPAVAPPIRFAVEDEGAGEAPPKAPGEVTPQPAHAAPADVATPPAERASAPPAVDGEELPAAAADEGPPYGALRLPEPRSPAAIAAANWAAEEAAGDDLPAAEASAELPWPYGSYAAASEEAEEKWPRLGAGLGLLALVVLGLAVGYLFRDSLARLVGFGPEPVLPVAAETATAAEPPGPPAEAAGQAAPEYVAIGAQGVAGRGERSSREAGAVARRILEISWRREAAGTRVVLQADGPLSDGRISHDRLAGPTVRELVRIRGIEEPYRAGEMVVGSAELSRIRTGFHPETAGSELHVVLDLATPGAEVKAVRVTGDRLELLVGAP